MSFSRRRILRDGGLIGLGLAANGWLSRLAADSQSISYCTQYGNPNQWPWASGSTPLLEGHSSAWSGSANETIIFHILANFEDGNAEPLVTANFYRIGVTDQLIYSAGWYMPKTIFV